MTNPFLALAIGGLKGAQSNREESLALSERKRKHDREDLEEKIFLAQLAQNPDFDISSIAPHVAAALGSAGGAAAGGGGGAPPLPPVRTGPTTLADAGALALPPPDTIRATPPPGVGGGPGAGPGAAGPVKVPPVPGGLDTPHVNAALDLGSTSVGGQQFDIKVQRGGKKARNRMAYETLHDADPEAYPHYIEDADYAGEMADYAKGVRQGRIERMKDTAHGRTSASTQSARVRVQLAEDMAYDLFEQGHTLEDVQASVARDPQARGGLSPARARMIQRDAAKAAPDLEQSRTRVRTQLGVPPRPMSEGAPVSDDVREAVIDALAHGHTGEEVIAAIKDPTVAHTVRRWLYRKGQASRKPAAATP